MEFLIEREIFHKALERVQGIVDKRNTLHLLSFVLIQTTQNGLKITASDSEIAFSGEFSANVMQQGEILLSAKQLFEIVKTLPSEVVHFSKLKNNSVEIQSDQAYFKILGTNSEGYPPIPDFLALNSFDINAIVLKRNIEQTFFSVASDKDIRGLNGSLLEFYYDENLKENILRMVSTDGHRLSLATQKIDHEVKNKQSYIVPRKGLLELKKLCDDFGDRNIKATFNNNAAIFEHENITFYMRLLEGDFPDYKQVIPKETSRKVIANRQSLIQSLKRVSIISSEKTHSVKFNIVLEGIHISTSHPDLGESKEFIKADVVGSDISIGFNYKYLLDALNVMESDQVVMELGESLTPSLLKNKDQNDVLFVIMPMRLD